MQVVLRQRFPLGRFHATPWRVSPFDDPYGEWPPSPWRLVRALVARWYQFQREVGAETAGETPEPLVRALCDSSYSFWLPPNARIVQALQSYEPAKWGWQPPDAKRPSRKGYGRILVRDNFWAVPPDTSVLWFIDGDNWRSDILNLLDRCLERIVYFGRAESLTEIVRAKSEPTDRPNVRLFANALSELSAPVLAPYEAKTEDVLRATDDSLARKRTVPPGARWMYAERPDRPMSWTPTVKHLSNPVRLVQFAVGAPIAPELRLLCRVTEQFRQRLLKVVGTEQARALGCDGPWKGWSAAPEEVRSALALLSGKDAEGSPLTGHRHLRLAIWFDGRRPARLLAWRDRDPFEDWEVAGLLRAAEQDLSWRPARGPSDWAIRLVPLDAQVPRPPGFSHRYPCKVWESMTPYVPLRALSRKDRPDRLRHEIERQVRHEVRQLGLCADNDLHVEVGEPSWVSVHLPQRKCRDGQKPIRLGFSLRVAFGQPVAGPIAIGHSSHYGLGLFRSSGS